MGIRKGDLRQVNLGGRNFDPAPETDMTMMLHGLTLENTPNGNGTIHTGGKRRLGGFDGLALSLDMSRGDMEYLQNWATSGVPKPCSVTLIDGTTYTGPLLPEGDLNFSSGNGTLDFAARGQTWKVV